MADTHLALLMTFTQEYSEPGSVALSSALEHAPPQTSVTIGTVDLGEASARRLRDVCARHGARLTIEDLSDLAAMFPTVGRYPPLAWTRALATEIFATRPRRVLYLDADVIVMAPMATLVGSPLGPAGLGAVADVTLPNHGARGLDYVRAVGSRAEAPYFNSGVMLLDLESWDAMNVSDRVLETVRGGRVPIDFIDQDVLNAVFVERWSGLDATWNMPADDSAVGAGIVQFSGTKPWMSEASGRYVEEYRRRAAAFGV